MVDDIILGYLLYQNHLAGRDYLVSRILFHAAPTLLNVKPASLLGFDRGLRSPDQLWRDYRADFGREFGQTFGVDYFELREGVAGSLVLFYNSLLLGQTLRCPENQALLGERGFPEYEGVEPTLRHLARQCGQTPFPHEIGIFLGIPAPDVRGFIKHQGRNYLCSGFWKVYQQPDQARQTFELYDRARLAVAGAAARLQKQTPPLAGGVLNQMN